MCPSAGRFGTKLLINEYSCANWRDITDFYLETEDWVELYNAGTVPINLQGFSLSDNEDNPTKWAFPSNTTVGPNGFSARLVLRGAM